jgi:hypothetical protein
MQDVLEHCNAYYEETSLRHFPSHVLGYVTPWNSHGYDVAKTFGNKFRKVDTSELELESSEATQVIETRLFYKLKITELGQ